MVRFQAISSSFPGSVIFRSQKATPGFFTPQPIILHFCEVACTTHRESTCGSLSFLVGIDQAVELDPRHRNQTEMV